MKLRNLHIQHQPQLMIIPMIDIIFFLLVFFMMSTLYMVEQHIIPVNLPQAAAVQQDLQKPVNITVKANGNVAFDQEEIRTELLPKRVQVEMQRNKDTIFVLRGDKDAAYGQVITVLDSLKQSGAGKISVAVERLR